MVKVNGILLTAAKIVLENRKCKEKKKALRRKEFIKNLINFIINAMMKDLIRKIKILILQIMII